MTCSFRHLEDGDPGASGRRRVHEAESIPQERGEGGEGESIWIIGVKELRCISLTRVKAPRNHNVVSGYSMTWVSGHVLAALAQPR